MTDKTKKCAKCGYEWEARKANPKECPQCKRRDWEGESENQR